MKNGIPRNLNIKSVSASFICAIFCLGATSFNALAQVNYTLANDDVSMVDGLITTCTYNFATNIEGTNLTIPSILDGQTVIGIADGTGDAWSTITGVFYDKAIKAVMLPSTLTYIGKFAFAQNKFTNITLPNGLKTIGEAAFYKNNLTSVTIPASVVAIRMNAFNENGSLSSVTFEPNSHLVLIDSHAFAQTSVNSITLPTPIVPDNNFVNWIKGDGLGTTYQGGESVSPSYNAFYANFVYTLTDADVVVENGVLKSCSYDFSGRFINIPSVLDGQSVTEIAGNQVQTSAIFYGKSMMGLTLPTTLTKIGDMVFNVNWLDKITIPANVTSIGKYAFWRSGVESVTFESNCKLENIGFAAFNNNRGLSLLLPSPVKEGYVFVKWTDYDDVDYVGGSSVTNFETSFTAKFTVASAVTGKMLETSVVYLQNNVLYMIIHGPHELELVDLSGKTVLAKSFNQVEPVDINHLKTGAYIVRITSRDGSFSQKVFKF